MTWDKKTGKVPYRKTVDGKVVEEGDVHYKHRRDEDDGITDTIFGDKSPITPHDGHGHIWAGKNNRGRNRRPGGRGKRPKKGAWLVLITPENVTLSMVTFSTLFHRRI